MDPWRFEGQVEFILIVNGAKRFKEMANRIGIDSTYCK